MTMLNIMMKIMVMKLMMMLMQVEILSTKLHSSLNLVGLALGNPLLSPKIQFRFAEMAQVENFDNFCSGLLRNVIQYFLR